MEFAHYKSWLRHGVCHRRFDPSIISRSPWSAAGNGVRAKGRQRIVGKGKVGGRRERRGDNGVGQSYQQKGSVAASLRRRALPPSWFRRCHSSWRR